MSSLLKTRFVLQSVVVCGGTSSGYCTAAIAAHAVAPASVFAKFFVPPTGFPLNRHGYLSVEGLTGHLNSVASAASAKVMLPLRTSPPSAEHLFEAASLL